MNHSSASPQPTPGDHSVKPFIVHRIVAGTNSTWCGRKFPTTAVTGKPTNHYREQEICPRCQAARQMDMELSRYMNDIAPLSTAAWELLRKLENGEA